MYRGKCSKCFNSSTDGGETLFYMPNIGNAVLFVLCNIIAVVMSGANRLHGETKDE
jgi:hypothetical protein